MEKTIKLKTFIRLSEDIRLAIIDYESNPELKKELRHEIALKFKDKSIYYCFNCKRVEHKEINEIKENC